MGIITFLLYGCIVVISGGTVLTKSDAESKVIVLRHALDEGAVNDIISRKKINVFRTLLKTPERSEVHVHSVKFYYEAILKVSARYEADFFRKAVHTIKVPYNVSEVVLGDGTFPAKTKSGIRKMLSGKKAKNSIDLKLEEHVFIETEDSMYFDHHGKEIKFPYKIGPATVENYPKRILRNSASQVKEPEIEQKDALEKLSEKLHRPLESDVRDLQDEFTVLETAKIYVPVFEARLVGPRKKIGILRIDAVRKKIL